jgi:lysyl-tRNA synthetase class 2
LVAILGPRGAGGVGPRAHFSMLRQRPQSDSPWLPRLTAALTALVGAVNIASALTPDIRWRGHLLLQVEALHTIEVFHALALPGGAALLLVCPYLLKRRRRARQLAFLLLVAVGFVNLLKGFDFEEALVGWGVAALLYMGRRQFDVEHEPVTLRSAVWRVPLIGALCVGLVAIANWTDHDRLKLLGESSALLRFKPGQDHFERHSAGAFGHEIHFAWIPLGVHFMEIGALLLVAYVIFRPLAAPKAWPAASVRRLAVEVVREHGQDTLSFFKLRPDKHYYFNEDRTAFVAYRVEAGTLLLSGDPVGPAEAFGDLLLQVRGFARSHGLKLAAVGVSEKLVKVYDELGLQALYIGDEAIVELQKFTLEGRPIRKVRQSVSRLTKAGFTAELRTLATLDRATLADIERVIELGRQGRPERGFSMAMDSIRGDCEQDTVLVLARDEAGVIRGVLHFVPCYGRPAVSLSMMRRDPRTPNGLTEFLVVRAIELLRERGIEEMSLNFATGARFMHAPKGRVEAGLGRLCHRLDRFFQIESLYRFNVKFFPRWDTRYLVYQGALGLPRAALASMWAEGQIPKPRLPLIHA